MSPVFAVVLLLFGSFLLVITVRGLLQTMSLLASAQAAETWPSVVGTVEAVAIEEGHSWSPQTRLETRTYRPTITYAYEVGGQVHRSDRIAFGDVLWYEQDPADAFLAEHPVGGPVTVHHHADKAHVSVLDPATSHATKLAGADVAMGVGGLVLVIVGIVGLLT